MNSYEANPGIFTLINVKWGNRGPNLEKAVIVTLKAEDGEILSVANNWPRGQQQRYDLAKNLIGKDIRYSTWQKNLYSKEWFDKIELASQNIGIDEEKHKSVQKFFDRIEKSKAHVEYTTEPSIKYKEKDKKIPKNNQDSIHKKVIKNDKEYEKLSKRTMYQKMQEALSQNTNKEDDSDDIKPF